MLVVEDCALPNNTVPRTLGEVVVPVFKDTCQLPLNNESLLSLNLDPIIVLSSKRR